MPIFTNEKNSRLISESQASPDEVSTTDTRLRVPKIIVRAGQLLQRLTRRDHFSDSETIHNNESNVEKFRKIFKEKCKDIPDSPLPAPLLQNLDPSGREEKIRVAADGLLSKEYVHARIPGYVSKVEPTTSRIETYTEEEIVSDLQLWQQKARQKLQEVKKNTNIPDKDLQKWQTYVDALIYFGDRELQNGAQVLAKRVLSHALEGRDVFLINSNFLGASYEYMTMVVLEHVSKILERFPNDMQEYFQQKIRSYNHRFSGTENFEQRVIQDLQMAEHPVMIGCDDWRITGNQVRKTVSTFHDLLKKSGKEKTDVEIELLFLFEANNRSPQSVALGTDPQKNPGKGHAYYDEKIEANIFAGYTGKSMMPQRQQGLGSTWTVVDFGFADSESSLREINSQFGIENPLALRLMRKTDSVPYLQPNEQNIYKDPELRQRYRRTFGEWDVFRDVAMPESFHRKEKIVEAAQQGTLGEIRFESGVEISLFLDSVDVQGRFAQSIVTQIISRIPKERFRRSIHFQEETPGRFSPELLGFIQQEVVQKIKNELELHVDPQLRISGQEIAHSVEKARVGVDRIIRVVMERLFANQEKKDKSTQDSVSEQIFFMDQVAIPVTELQGEIGEKIQKAKRIFLKEKDGVLVCDVFFNSHKIPFLTPGKYPDGMMANIAIESHLKDTVPQVTVEYVDREHSTADVVNQVAVFLDAQGFKNQFEYKWQSGEHLFAKDFTLLPQEILSGDDTLRDWIRKSRQIGERMFLRQQINAVVEMIFQKENAGSSLDTNNPDQVWQVIKAAITEKTVNEAEILMSQLEETTLQWAKKYALEKVQRTMHRVKLSPF